jgi:hypothetical protein
MRGHLRPPTPRPKSPDSSVRKSGAISPREGGEEAAIFLEVGVLSVDGQDYADVKYHETLHVKAFCGLG